MSAPAEIGEVGPAKGGKLGPFTAYVVTGALLAAVLIYQGHHALIAFEPGDTNHLETPLLLATARQIADGPSTLYGPFSGEDPLVLIHAPLYYRMAGLIAFPMAKLGVDPIRSAFIAARGLAFVGFLTTIFAAWWIARMERGSGLAGVWAALLVAGTPVFGSFGFTVRPDTLAIGFQTLAFGCAWSAARPVGSGARWFPMALAGVLFGLSACAKQHLIVAWGVTFVVVFLIRCRKRISLATLVAIPVLVALAYYGWEQWATGGEMAKSVFVLPSRLRQTSPASQGHVGKVFYEVAKLAAGMFALGLAVGFGRARAWIGNRLDAALWLLLAAEVAAMIPLCLGSQGAWVNYAMPGAVWGSILLARAMSRAVYDPRAGLGVLLLAPAALLALMVDARLAAISYTMRRDDAAIMRQVLSDPDVSALPPSARYFVGMPQENRLHGRSALAHDEWLYSSYEALDMAEPRRTWLFRAITGEGPVRVVIVPSTDQFEGAGHVYGLPWALTQLGYRVHQQYGRFAVWVRRDPTR